MSRLGRVPRLGRISRLPLRWHLSHAGVTVWLEVRRGAVHGLMGLLREAGLGRVRLGDIRLGLTASSSGGGGKGGLVLGVGIAAIADQEEEEEEGESAETCDATDDAADDGTNGGGRAGAVASVRTSSGRGRRSPTGCARRGGGPRGRGLGVVGRGREEGF